MNILPKKRWHVRTKENIARVRRDEAQAAEEEKEKLRRALLAEQEARTTALREKVRSRFKGNFVEEPDENVPESGKFEHVNLFNDLEDGKIVTNKTNTEYEREQKEEKEKYEKQIGYLTYLGQDTVEATGKISWYNKLPDRLSNASDSSEVGSKSKFIADPLTLMKKFVPSSEYTKSSSVKVDALTNTTSKREQLSCSRSQSGKCNQRRKHKEKKRHSFKHSKKCKRRRNYSSDSYDSDASQKKNSSKRRHKNNKNERESSLSSSESSSSSDSSDSFADTPKRCKVDLEQLRAERLRREHEEQLRTQALLAKVRGEPPPLLQPEEPAHIPIVKQKYNSQFNPELARQNFPQTSL